MKTNGIIKGSISIITALTIFMPFACMKAAGYDCDIKIFAAPNGSDDNNGTKDSPVKTLERARGLANAAKAENVSVEVVFREGEYALPEPITLTAEDSGYENAPVVYKAYDGEKVSFTGGITIPSEKFTLSDRTENVAYEVRGKLYEADLSEYIGIFDDFKAADSGMGYAYYALYKGDRRLTIARYPNEGYFISGAAVAADPSKEYKKYGGFEYEPELTNRWSDARYAVAGGYPGNDWSYQNIPIKIEDNRIYLTERPNYGIYANRRFMIFNLLEELDIPGEWYIDQDEKKLYYYPDGDIKDSDITLAAAKNNLVDINGASNIVFEGIHFKNTRGAGIVISNSENVEIYGCTVSGTGTDGITVTGSTGCGVRSSRIYDTGLKGVSLSGGDRIRLIPAGNYAENCDIHDFALETKTYNGGVELSGCGNICVHNKIHESPHLAVYFSGNDHVIEYNEIFDAVKETSDAGAVYAGRNWTMRGTRICFNYFHDIKKENETEEDYESNSGVDTVYLDDMYSGTAVESNIFYNCSRAAHIGGGRDNTFRNNIIIDSGRAVYYDERARAGQWANYHVVSGGAVYNSFKNAMASSGFDKGKWCEKYPGFEGLIHLIESYDADNTVDTGLPSGGVVEDNIFIGTQSVNYTKISGIVAGNQGFALTRAEAGFHNGNNFSFTHDSKIYDYVRDFPNIPFNEIGIYTDEYMNGYADKGAGIQLIAAVKDDNGVLQGISIKKTSLYHSEGEEFSIPVDIPENVRDGWVIECYIWDGNNELGPLYKNKVIIQDSNNIIGVQ